MQNTLPWVAWRVGGSQRFFEAGEVRLAILSLLHDGAKHGYQLMREMSERAGGTYKASAGSIYPTLQQLESDRLVSAAMIGGRRTYALTKSGRKELDADPETVRRIWERAEERSQCLSPQAIMMYAPLVDLFKTGLQAAGRVAGKREGAERIRTIIDRARRDLEKL